MTKPLFTIPGPPMPNPLPPNDNRGPALLGVGWMEAFIGLSLLGLRMWTRGRIVKSIGWDDWVMVFAAILALVTTILVTLEVHWGVGRHVWYLTPTQQENALEMIWLTAPFSTMSACFGKISIALLLMRLMAYNKIRFYFLWFIIVSLFIVNLLLTIITFAQCTPVTYLWTRFFPGSEGSCWNPNVQLHYGLFQGSYSAFTDFILAVFPLTFLWTLQVNLRLKIGLAILLGLGVIATVAASIKTAELHELAQPDFTWAPVDLVFWYLTENWIIIICGCAPTLPPLFSRKWRGRDSRGSGATPVISAPRPHDASYGSGRTLVADRAPQLDVRKPVDSWDDDLEKGDEASTERSVSPQEMMEADRTDTPEVLRHGRISP